MKNTLTKILCLSLSFQLAFGTLLASQSSAQAPVANTEWKKKAVTSPATFFDTVQKEGESLFGPDGPAYFDEQTGKVYIKNNSTTSSAIHEDEKKANSLNTYKQIEAFLPRAKFAQELYSSMKEVDKDKINQNCPTCGGSNFVNPLAKEDGQIPADGLCSKNDKRAIEKEIASNPSQCGFKAEFKKATSKPGNAFRCLGDAIDSFFSSLGTMAKSIYTLGKGLGKDNAKKKLFESYKPVEKNASSTALVLSGMSEKDRALARESVDKANSSFMDKFWGAISWVGQWILNLDVPMYKEMFQCAKCGDRGAALCKIVGVFGKDIFQNMIMLYVGGKVVQGIAKYGAKVIGAGRSTAMKAALSEFAVGRYAVKWGGRVASFSVKAANRYTKFLETKVGKVVSAIGRGGMKIVNFTDDISMGIINKAKALPSKITIRGGKKVATEIAEQTRRAEIFAHTPGLDDAAKAGTTPGLSTLDELASTSSRLEVEVSRPLTKEMKDAKRLIAKTEKKGLSKNFVDDIENATASSADIVNNKTIKVQTANGEKYVQINPDDIRDAKKAYFYQFGENSEKGIFKGNRDVYYIENGKAVKVPAHERPAVDKMISDMEHTKSNKLSVADAKENIKASGGKVEEPVASVKDGEADKFKTNTPEGCNPKSVEVDGAASAARSIL